MGISGSTESTSLLKGSSLEPRFINRGFTFRCPRAHVAQKCKGDNTDTPTELDSSVCKAFSIAAFETVEFGFSLALRRNEWPARHDTK